MSLELNCNLPNKYDFIFSTHGIKSKALASRVMNQIITGLKHKIKSAVNGQNTGTFDARNMEFEVRYRFSLDIFEIKERVNLYAVRVAETETESLIYYWFERDNVVKYVRTLEQFTKKINLQKWVHTN